MAGAQRVTPLRVEVFDLEPLARDAAGVLLGQEDGGGHTGFGAAPWESGWRALRVEPGMSTFAATPCGLSSCAMAAT